MNPWSRAQRQKRHPYFVGNKARDTDLSYGPLCFVLGPGKEPTVHNQTWVLPLGVGDLVVMFQLKSWCPFYFFLLCPCPWLLIKFDSMFLWVCPLGTSEISETHQSNLCLLNWEYCQSNGNPTQHLHTWVWHRPQLLGLDLQLRAHRQLESSHLHRSQHPRLTARWVGPHSPEVTA